MLNQLLQTKHGIEGTEVYWNNLVEKYKTEFHPYLYSLEFQVPFKEVIDHLLFWVRDIEPTSFVTELELKSLSAPLVLFTENSLRFAETILTKAGLLSQFDYLLGFESFQFKPKNQAYELTDKFVRSIYGNNVSITFIDDSVKNLESVPEELGWEKILFLKSPYAQKRLTDDKKSMFRSIYSFSDFAEFIYVPGL